MYFIIGASSFIGKHLYNYCTEQNIDVVGTYYTHSDHKEWIKFDICNDNFYEMFYDYMDNNGCNTVIICGANTNIDNCKRNEEHSNNLNVKGIRRIIEQADEVGMQCVFLSSETVFDGKRGMYTEEDIPNPISVYGRQKLLMEQFIVNHAKNYLIFRISRAVGSCYGEKDIFDEFYYKIIHGEEIICLKNQSFCITEVNDIVQCIVRAIDRKISGTYNLSSDNYVSRYELAKLYIKKIFGHYDMVTEKEYKDIPFLDNRHILGGLNGEKLSNMLGIHYMSIEEILNKYKITYERAMKDSFEKEK